MHEDLLEYLKKNHLTNCQSSVKLNPTMRQQIEADIEKVIHG